MRGTWAKWRQPLGHALTLAGIGAALGCLLPAVLALGPVSWQRPAAAWLAAVPGIDEAMSLSGRAEGVQVEKRRVLRVLGRRVAAELPPDDGAWLAPGAGARVRWPAFAWLGGLGALVGACLTISWHAPRLRARVLGGGLVGAALGVAYSLTLVAGLSGWTAAGVRGMAGWPGWSLERPPPGRFAERLIESPRLLKVAGALAAEIPPGDPPWGDADDVRVTGAGRAWLAGAGALAVIALVALVAGLRGERPVRRALLRGGALGVLLWLALPFPPLSVQEPALEGLAWLPGVRIVDWTPPPEPEAGAVMTRRLELGPVQLASFPPPRDLGGTGDVSVHLALVPVLAAPLVLVALLLELLLAGSRTLARRRRAAAEPEDGDTLPGPIELHPEREPPPGTLEGSDGQPR